MNATKTYFDDYMVECFRVRDIKLIFLLGCDQDHFGRSDSTNPKEGLNLDNTTICECSTYFPGI